MSLYSTKSPAIEADRLRKRFGEVEALRDVSFSVERGTILGLLGPNGSGKSTTVRALSTLLRPDSGTGRINGVDVLADPEQARAQFGLAGQSASVDELLSGRNNLTLIGQLYQMSTRDAKRRADELLEQFDLVDAADRLARTYSGGMRRRLDLAASLVATPPVIFLDEPTTGLDPRSRLAIWGVIGQLVRNGTSILLTTQYLEEADRLADRIVVIDQGCVIANDTPRGLKAAAGDDQIVVTVQREIDIPVAQEALETVTGIEPTVVTDALQLTAPATGGEMLTDVMQTLKTRGIAIDDIGLRRPTLDEVFLQLTGQDIGNLQAADAHEEMEVA